MTSDDEMISKENNAIESPQEEERLLNQNEIDTLLGFSTSDEKTQGLKELLENKAVAYDRLPMLEVLFERFIRKMTTTMRNFTSEHVEVSIENFTSIRFGNFINNIQPLSLLGIVKAVEWKNLCLLTIDSSLIYSMINILLGGKRSKNTQENERPYTSIERNLLSKMINLILEDLTCAFDPISKVDFKLERLETNPQVINFAKPLDSTIIINIQIKIGDRCGCIQIMIPYATLEPIRELLLQMFAGEKFGQDKTWGHHLAGAVWSTDIVLDAILGETEMHLEDVLSWKPGSQIVFPIKTDSEIHIRCGKLDVWRGKIGQRSGNAAIRVTENYIQQGEEDELHDHV